MNMYLRAGADEIGCERRLLQALLVMSEVGWRREKAEAGSRIGIVIFPMGLRAFNADI